MERQDSGTQGKKEDNLISSPNCLQGSKVEYSAIRLQVFTVVFNPLDLLNVKPFAELDTNCTCRSFANPV